MRVGVLTISDRVSKGDMEDRGGAAVIAALGGAVDRIEIVTETLPDDGERITRLLATWSDEDQLDAIITTGGTGLGPRDVTPEATLEAIGRRVPGIEEALRAAGLAKLPMAMLSRGVAGVRGQTLIVNLPGSPTGAAEGTAILAEVLTHAVDLLHGRTRHGG